MTMTEKNAESSSPNDKIVIKGLDVNPKICPEKADKEPAIPDGGWGWLVVIASFIMLTCAHGIMAFSSTLVVRYHEYFNITYNVVSKFTTFFPGMPLLAGPIMGALVARYGCRVTTIIAALVSTVGFVLPVFINTVNKLFLTSAIVVGVAIATFHIVAIVSVALWFDKRRNLAISLVSCGILLGWRVYLPMADLFSEQDAWMNIFVVVASMLLLCVCGALIKNPEWLEVKQERERTLSEAKMNVEKSSKHQKEQESNPCFQQMTKKTFDFRKFMGFHFLMFSLSGLILIVSVNLSSVYIYVMLHHTQHTNDVTFIISILNFIGFITLGWVGDRFSANVTKIHCACLVILSLIVAACPFFFDRIWGMVVISALFGFFSASFVSYAPSILIQILSMDDLPVAYGLTLFNQGIGRLVALFIIELVAFDSRESIRPVFYASGAGLAISALCVVVIAYSKKSGSTDMSRDRKSDVTAAA